MGFLSSPISIEILKHDIILDNECWACNGGHDLLDEYTDENGECEICGGSGYQLTDAGRSIMQLVTRHYKKGK